VLTKEYKEIALAKLKCVSPNRMIEIFKAIGSTKLNNIFKSDEQICKESIGIVYSYEDKYANCVREKTVESVVIRIEDGQVCFNYRYPNDGPWSNTWYGMKVPCSWHVHEITDGKEVGKWIKINGKWKKP
jgi:hypothetical protein